MGDLVDQCEAWGLVTRTPDPRDARATPIGLHRRSDWPGCRPIRQAVAQAEAELRAGGRQPRWPRWWHWVWRPTAALSASASGRMCRPGPRIAATRLSITDGDAMRILIAEDDQVLADGLLRACAVPAPR
jgi:hypothetical protein